MIVFFNEKRVLVVPVMVSRDGVLKPSGNINLVYGNNDIPDKKWEGVKTLLESHLEDGRIKIVEEEVIIEEKKGDKVIKKKVKTSTPKQMSAVRMRALIEETFSIKTLETWLRNENRDEIRARLKDKIEAVRSYKPPKKQSDVVEGVGE